MSEPVEGSVSTPEQLHYDSFVHDYYPFGVPLIIDDEAHAFVKQASAGGIDGAAILAMVADSILEEMENRSKRGDRLKEEMAALLLESGVNSIAITLGNISKPLSDYTNITNSIKWWSRFTKYFEVMRVCRSARDARLPFDAGAIAVTYCLQDAGCIGEDIDLVNELYGHGVRSMQITLNRSNILGSGCVQPAHYGLTKFGQRVIRRLNELGVMIDVSHCNYQTTMDSIRYSELPVMVSHGACKSVFPHDRGKSDEEIKALADKEGFFGVLFVPCFIGSDPEPGFDVVIDHLRWAADILGVEGVGIGSDWGVWSPDVPPELREGIIESAVKNLGMSRGMNLSAGTAPGGMKDYGDMWMVTEALSNAGFSPGEIKGIVGENFLRFWARVAP